MESATRTEWRLRGTGYEFCNCDFGCGCNFGGFPNSKDGSCRAVVGTGHRGGILWRRSAERREVRGNRSMAEGHSRGWRQMRVHRGPVHHGQADRRARADLYGGKLGGMPWELLGPTFEVVGLEKAKITIEGEGLKSVFRAEGLARGARRHLQESGDRRRTSRQRRAAGRVHLDARCMRPGNLPRESRRTESVLRQDQLDSLRVQLAQRAGRNRRGLRGNEAKNDK